MVRRSHIGLIAIIVVIVGLSLFFLAKSGVSSTGKAIEITQDGCYLHCTFRGISEGEVRDVSVPMNGSAAVQIGDDAVHVSVREVDVVGQRCLFDLQHGVGRNSIYYTEVVGWQTDSFYRGSLELVGVGCEECVEARHQDHSTLFYESERGIGEVNYEIEPGYIVNESGVQAVHCDENTVISPTCSEPIEYSCDEGFSCQEGLCVSCEDVELEEGAVRVEFAGLGGERFDSYCDDATLVTYSCGAQGGMARTETQCAQGCFETDARGAACFEGCTDSDEEDVHIAHNVTGFVLYDTYRGGFEQRVGMREDSCVGSEVVEQVCREDGFIEQKRIACPTGEVCRLGACVRAPPTFGIEESGSSGIRLTLVDENVDMPFYVAMTFYNAQGEIVGFHRERIEGSRDQYSYYVSASISAQEDVVRKEVVVYDTLNQDAWKVYLNESFVIEYGGAQ